MSPLQLKILQWFLIMLIKSPTSLPRAFEALRDLAPS